MKLEERTVIEGVEEKGAERICGPKREGDQQLA
jgi:hypothetical protein